MRTSFLFLGTGASAGVPVIGCRCAVCLSSSEKNKRLRTAGLLRVGAKQILVDVGPDFRTQALEHQIHHLDGVIVTHSHFDHIAGLDDLRIYYLRQQHALPLLCSSDTYSELKKSFYYLFDFEHDPFSKSQKFALQLVKEDHETLKFCDVPFDFFSYFQAGMRVLGFRVGDFAYVSDIRDYEESLFDSLRGIDTLVVSALRHKSSHVHFNIEEAIAFSRKTGARKTFLTHIAHDLDYDKTNDSLPEGFKLAYDGLEIPFDMEDTWQN